jgi:hypothetical protein
MFQSPQAVRAHLKHCRRYQTIKSQKLRALGTEPKAPTTLAATPPVLSSSPVVAPDLSGPLRNFMKSMHESATKQDAPQKPQQKGRTILQSVKTRVIDRYGTPLDQITASMRGAAKMAIERELSTLPLEELGFEEVCELAVAIRDRLYATACKRQALEAERQHVEKERRQKKEVEALGALIRADRRKKIFIQQASHHAHAYCQEKAIIGWAHLSLLADVESRLEAFLTGDEPIMEAQAIVQSVLGTRFAEAEATLAAARAKADEQWHEEVAAVLVLGAVAGLVVLSLNYPAQTLAILNWIERMFGFAAEAEAGTSKSDASETTPPAASAESRRPSRRWRKDPVSPSDPASPWEHSVGTEAGHA